jgi:chromosome segregation ATPase
VKNSLLLDSVRAKETRLKSLEAMIEQFEVDIKDLDLRKNELRSIEEALSLRKLDIQNVEQSLDEMKSEMMQLGDQLSELEQEAIQRELEVGQAKIELKAIEAKAGKQKAVSFRVTDLESQIKVKSDLLKEFTESLNLKTRELAKVEKLLTESSEAYRHSMSQNKDYLETLTEKVKDLELEESEYQIRIPRMRSEDETLTKIVVGLRKESSDKQKLLQGINQNLKFANGQIEDLKKVIFSLEDMHGEKKLEMRRMAEENDEMVYRNKTLKKEEIDLRIDWETYSKMRDN